VLWVEIESAMERACFGDGKRGRAIGTLKLERSTVYALQYEEVLDATLEEERLALYLATLLVALVEFVKITIASAMTSITAGAMFLMTLKIG